MQAFREQLRSATPLKKLAFEFIGKMKALASAEDRFVHLVTRLNSARYSINKGGAQQGDLDKDRSTFFMSKADLTTFSKVCEVRQRWSTAVTPHGDVDEN